MKKQDFNIKHFQRGFDYIFEAFNNPECKKMKENIERQYKEGKLNEWANEFVKEIEAKIEEEEILKAAGPAKKNRKTYL